MITLTAIVVALALGSFAIQSWNAAAARQESRSAAEQPAEQN